jgi:hypothetical protein
MLASKLVLSGSGEMLIRGSSLIGPTGLWPGLCPVGASKRKWGAPGPRHTGSLFVDFILFWKNQHQFDIEIWVMPDECNEFRGTSSASST